MMNGRQLDKQLRVFEFGFPLILLLLAWRHEVKYGWDLWSSGFVAGAGGFFLLSRNKSLLLRMFQGWMVISGVIGKLITVFILILVYYGVFTPVAFLLRSLGKGYMNKRLDAGVPSYWIQRPMFQRPAREYTQQF